MKKNKLKVLPIIDPGALPASAKKKLATAWKKLKEQELLAVSDLGRDPVHVRIDEAICDALCIDPDPVTALRELLGSEPRFAPVPKKRRALVPPPQRELF